MTTRAVAALAAGILGLVTTAASALVLVPRVRLVEVLTVVAAAFGSGAALTAAILRIRDTRAANRAERHDARGDDPRT